MNQRMRSPKRPSAAGSPPFKIDERFHRFLRPGALARLRDTRLSTSSRSTRSAALLLLAARNHRITPPSPPSDGAAAAPQISAALLDGSPFFAGCRIQGPRCPQRKKLHAARAMFLIPGSPGRADAPPDDLPALDQISSDFLLAH